MRGEERQRRIVEAGEGVRVEGAEIEDVVIVKESFLQEAHRHIASRVEAGGGRIAGFYFCPHHPDGTVPRYAVDCFCRKPQPGILLKAAREREIDLRASWLIGATLHDVEAGNRAGCRTLLIDNGTETEWRLGPRRVPTRIAPDLHAAAVLIAAEGDTRR